MISVVILNFKRPNNIINNILPEITKYKIINEIIISHCNEETYFEYPHEKVICRNDVGVNQRYSLYRRFIVCEHAKNDCILILDDDIIIGELELKTLYEKWFLEKNVIHGVFGRKLIDFKYTFNDTYGRVPIVLTRCMLISKELIMKANLEKERVEPFVISAQPKWNGEDIYMSLFVCSLTNKLNFAHSEIKTTDLDDSHAISKWDGHQNHRTFIAKKIAEIFSIHNDTLH